jgi:hypothetical protein
MKKEYLQEELRDLSPLLSALKDRKAPMATPPDYFEQLPEKVLEKLEAEGLRQKPDPAPAWRISWNQSARLSAIAAAIALLLVAAWFLLPFNTHSPAITQTQPPVTAPPETLTPELAAAYISENIHEFDAEMMALAFEENTEQTPAANEQKPAGKRAKKKSTDELDEILDELTDEELEELL